MQTFDQSLFYLYKGGLITVEEALRRATNPDEFKLKLAGVQFTADIAREEMEGSLQGEDDDLMREDSPFEVERIEPAGKLGAP
jgi:twitching motility protein PilT